MQGSNVANLQDALVALLERTAFLPNEPDSRQELLTLLQEERRSFYGDVTGKIVGIFQQERDLTTHGRVDEPMADALNALLTNLGILNSSHSFEVSGRVTRAGGRQERRPRHVARRRHDRRGWEIGERFGTSGAAVSQSWRLALDE